MGGVGPKVVNIWEAHYTRLGIVVIPGQQPLSCGGGKHCHIEPILGKTLQNIRQWDDGTSGSQGVRDPA